MRASRTLAMALPAIVAGQKPQYPPPFPPTPVLPSSINYAPSVTPNIMDTTAPNAQVVCPGYTASDVQETTTGLTADLTLGGQGCNAHGNDVKYLTLSVQYQSQERLAVRIYPKHLQPSNQSLYILSPSFTPQPGIGYGASKASSDLTFTWTNSPSFQFKVVRASSGEIIFDTYGQNRI